MNTARQSKVAYAQQWDILAKKQNGHFYSLQRMRSFV